MSGPGASPAELRLGILGSGRGSNLDSIAAAIHVGALAARIECVFSDVPGAGIERVARKWGIRFEQIPPSAYRTRLEAEIESHVADALKRFGVECVVLAGYMRVVKNPLLQAFPGRILNMHPSLLPQFPGKDAWKQALDAGVTVTGCSVHVVDDGVDTGTVLAQRRVPVLPGDTPDRLHARIQEAEHVLYPEVLNRWAGRIRAGTTGGAEPRGPE